jgi:MOSC domain-containing protein YiiM
MARVTHLFRALTKRAPMEELQEALAVEDVGLGGCAHARPQSKRQVLLMDEETLAAFGLAPGIVRENVTTQGLPVNGLAIGQRLRIGEAEFELTLVCDPCVQIEALRPGLQAAIKGKRGMLCKVLRGGKIQRGDEIVVLSAGVPHADLAGGTL